LSKVKVTITLDDDAKGKPTVPVVVTQGRPSRTSALYWYRAIFRPIASRNGKRTQSANLRGQFYTKGRRIVLSLGTSNRAAAAHTARNIFVFVQEHGWEAELQWLQPGNNRQSFATNEPSEYQTRLADAMHAVLKQIKAEREAAKTEAKP
jgi:hypothetical protein